MGAPVVGAQLIGEEPRFVLCRLRAANCLLQLCPQTTALDNKPAFTPRTLLSQYLFTEKLADVAVRSGRESAR
jgi:hypothetical protein